MDLNKPGPEYEKLGLAFFKAAETKLRTFHLKLEKPGLARRSGLKVGLPVNITRAEACTCLKAQNLGRLDRMRI